MPKIIPRQNNSFSNIAPTPSDLEVGELGVNANTGTLYTKTTDGIVVAVKGYSESQPQQTFDQGKDFQLVSGSTVAEVKGQPNYRLVSRNIREGSFCVTANAGDEFGEALGTKVEAYNIQRESRASFCAYTQDGTELTVSANGQGDAAGLGGANAASIKYHGTNGLHIGGSLVDAGTVKSDVAFKVEVAVSGTACEATTTFTGNVNITGTEETIGVSSSSGAKGDIKFDSNYLYICVATDTWKRVALASF